jgi:hypothetical protein
VTSTVINPPSLPFLSLRCKPVHQSAKADHISQQTLGFDGSMMNGLNILPSYTDYFTLTTATLALNTASVWMGSVISGIAYGKVPDIIGRKWALFFGAILTIIGVIIQTASQNIAMFVIARIIIGFGTGASSIAGPIYLAETLPVKYRAWGLGIFYDFWQVHSIPYLLRTFPRDPRPRPGETGCSDLPLTNIVATTQVRRRPHRRRRHIRHRQVRLNMGMAPPILTPMPLQHHVSLPLALDARESTMARVPRT